MMDVSLFIARRVRFKDRIAIISIAISFLVIIIAVAVSSGFRKEIRGGISELSADVVIMSPGGSAVEMTSSVEKDAGYVPYLNEIYGVEQVRPVVYTPGLMQQNEELYGILFKGTDGFFPDTLNLPVSLPSDLAKRAGVGVGDKIQVYFISDKVKVRKFNVYSLYEPLVETGENPVVMARISDLQRLNAWEENQVSCMEIILEDSYKNTEMMSSTAFMAGMMIEQYSDEDDSSAIAVSSYSRFRVVFDWLDVIDFNVVIILILMTIVAGFNMISSLLILLFENISTIGLLKSLGMTDRSISKVFLASSASLVFKGMLLGNAVAVLFCLIQDTTHVLKLDPENYFVSYVPVNLDLVTVFTTDIMAFAAIMLLMLIPCLFISKVDPAETVRVK